MLYFLVHKDDAHMNEHKKAVLRQNDILSSPVTTSKDDAHIIVRTTLLKGGTAKNWKLFKERIEHMT